MRRILLQFSHFLMLFLLLASSCRSSLGFAVVPPKAHGVSTSIRRQVPSTFRRTILVINAENDSEDKDDDFFLLDANDEAIRVGQAVQVIAKNCKAHQVPKKAYGSFDDGGDFVPSDDTNYLKIPVGLVGRIAKLYDNEGQRTSANYPIQVQFDADSEDTFQVPVPFAMHFSSKEVELVETNDE